MLRANAEAQLATLSITSAGVTVRETPNDETLDRHSLGLEGDRVDRARRPTCRPRWTARRSRSGGPRRRGRAPTAPATSACAPSRRRARRARALGRGRRRAVDRAAGAPAEARSCSARWSSPRSCCSPAPSRCAARSTGRCEPVAQMTASAEDWGAHDLDRRFDLGPPRDELTGLAATLDGLLARIAASRRHEQRFASEVAHELRTPLAGLRGRAELALGATGPRRDRRAGRSPARGRRPGRSARRTRSTRCSPSRGASSTRPRARSTSPRSHARSSDVEVYEPPGDLPLAEGEPDVVRRALAPLVDNARRHARERVTLELSTGDGRVRLTVRDDGPGLDPALGERAFDPGVRGPRRDVARRRPRAAARAAPRALVRRRRR